MLGKSLYSGLAEHFGKYLPLPTMTSFNASSMHLGQVLGVVTGEEVEEGIANGDITDASIAHRYVGLVSFKMQIKDDEKFESETARFAFPIDKNTFRLPIPGELILVIKGRFADDFDQSTGGYFYTRVITGTFPVRDAIQPNAVTNPKKVERPQGAFSAVLDDGLISTRFEKRLSHNVHTVKKEGKVFPTMREGDKILEGRFGGSIRFTSTIEKKDVWATQEGVDSLTKGSIDGDPFIIVKAAKLADQSTGADQDAPKLVDDDINADESSIYINTSQYIPLNIASSKAMYTWGYEIPRSGVPLTLQDPSKQLQAFFPDKYDPNVGITINADFPIQPGAFDDNPSNDKAGAFQPIPYNPTANTAIEKAVVEALNLSFARGETKHYCARGTYNHAYNLAQRLRGLPGAEGLGIAAGGNANGVGYFNKLVQLGFTRYDQGSNIASAQLGRILKNGPGSPWGMGDVVAYWSNDGGVKESNRLYGHTQMYVGKVTGLGNWTTDNKYNYEGSSFVYASRNANSWNLIVFKPPQT